MITDMFGRELKVDNFVLYVPIRKIRVGRLLGWYDFGGLYRLKLTGPFPGNVSWEYASNCIKLHSESIPVSVLEEISRDFPGEQYNPIPRQV